MSKKYKFEPDIWIKFNFDGHECVGRTLYIQGHEMVATVQDNGYIGHIRYELLSDTKKLGFLGNQRKALLEETKEEKPMFYPILGSFVSSN